MNLYEVSGAVSLRAQGLRAQGLELHAHALEYMVASLTRRDAPGDWSVLEGLARECEAAMAAEANPLGDPPAELADAWARYQRGDHVEPYEMRSLDEWRADRAEEAGL